MKQVLIIGLLLGLVACQRPADNTPNYSYGNGYNGYNGYNGENSENSENSCSMGAQSFRSVEDYCESLKNEDMNHGCSVNARLEAFQRDCGGRNWNQR